jgi:predicted amidohydrolase
MKLTVATCQFPVDPDMRRNLQYVSWQIRAAKERGAQVAHFPEACLSGYAGVDFPSYQGFDWALLHECTQEVLDLARPFRLWVVLGSTHRLTGRHKPHNSLYVINDHGKLVDRYDKMFCAGDRAGKSIDLTHYSPGNHFSVFVIEGVRCGARHSLGDRCDRWGDIPRRVNARQHRQTPGLAPKPFDHKT